MLSTPNNTIVFVSMSGPLTAVKTIIFETLLSTSPFPVAVGYDTGQSNRTQANILKVLERTRRRMQRRVVTVPMSDANLKRLYGEKIHNFAAAGTAGRGKDSPGKLGPLHWFQTTGSYDFVWCLEDDTWSVDFGLFARSYANSTADLVIRPYYTHPPWVASGFKLSRRHLIPEGSFCFALLGAYRASRNFVRAVLHAISTEPTTSHHEIFFPYVIASHRPRLTWTPLLAASNHEVYGSWNDLTVFKPLCALRNAPLYHPVKSRCGDVEGYNLDMGPCENCPHPAQGLVSWRACRKLCNQMRGCTAWVYNSNLECYLKAGGLVWSKEEETWNGKTWSGPASWSDTVLLRSRNTNEERYPALDDGPGAQEKSE